MKITGIFDFLSRHRRVRAVSLAVATVVLIALTLTLHFSEDISDFLPLETEEREYLNIYQNISGADRMVILFSNEDGVDRTIEAIDCFVDTLKCLDRDNWCGSLTYQFGTDDILQVSNFIYANAPYFLTSEDYQRMDSLMADPHYVEKQMATDKEMLMFPSSSFVGDAISRDPLSLFAPVLSRLGTAGGQMSFNMEQGYIFTPDMSRAVVMMTSPFGNSETENNSKLMGLLDKTSDIVREMYPGQRVDIIGGPAIAVGNSSRIKTDSIIAVCLSVALIIILLVYSFSSVRNIFLIFLSIGWGLIFALGGIALFSDKVSIIVIGISSVILGIAANYPLHLIAQTAYQPDRSSALKEIISPLVVGNITTVGAFLALVPLKSTALRDLGLFASLLLVGTMIFVILYLPHYIEIKETRRFRSRLLDSLSKVRPERHPWVLICVGLATVVLAVFSLRTGFDSNIANINYMTPGQKEDMQYFMDLLDNDTEHNAVTLYAFGSGSSYEEALEANAPISHIIDSLAASGLVARQNEAASFLVSVEVQRQRLERWRMFVDEHRHELTDHLEECAIKSGFSATAFNGFRSLVEDSSVMEPLGPESFETLTSTVFSSSVTSSDDGRRHYFVNALNVKPEDLETVKSCLGVSCFDVAQMNGALTSSLSDKFNYIGWACSLIVFFFLWFSFGRIELAVISFLPMAVSWIWILGIMALLGIKFNIVNIILATFIFGQGDDYTIFITEGCQYEFARRQPILTSYKSGIIQSAAIMFVGIGTLIVARHPALRSLAEVTIIGMFSVVLMAYLIPPFLFRWLTTRRGKVRKSPVTFKSIILGQPDGACDVVRSRYVYKGKEIERCVKENLALHAEDVINLDLDGYDSYDYVDSGYGELALLLALTHPSVRVKVFMDDADRLRVAQVALEDMTDNIESINISQI